MSITLPEDVLQAIDRYAEHHGYSRSAFIARAARKAIEDAVAGRHRKVLTTPGDPGHRLFNM